MFKKPSTYIVLLVIAVLTVIGGIMNSRRESNSVCGESIYLDFFRSKMINGGPGKGYENQSIYYGALQAALASDRLDPGVRKELEVEMDKIRADIENAKIFAREVSPSSSTNLTCVYKLKVGVTQVETRFKLNIYDMPGTEFEKRFKKRQGSLILLEELQPGVPVESVLVAKIALPQYKIQEPQFPGVRFDHSYTPDILIPKGVIKNIPK